MNDNRTSTQLPHKEVAMLGRTSLPEVTWSPVSSDNGKGAALTTLLTVLGQSARIEGKFDITESLHIECEVAGELNIGGQLVIGGKGVVNANVHTVDAIIRGVYEGNMVATSNIEITETGRVTGNLETDSFVIDKGGFFNGNVVRRTSQAQDSARDAAVESPRDTAQAV
jgi:cytoskeletal protein CcmA (bactofilin family)